MNDDLKPCPFCGAKAEIQWESTQGFVSCTNEECYATSTWFSSDDAEWVEKQIIPRWNRRATSAEVTALRARIAELEEQQQDDEMREDDMHTHMVIQRAALNAADARIAELEAQRWEPLEDGFHTGSFGKFGLANNNNPKMITFVKSDNGYVALGFDMAVCRRPQQEPTNE